MTARVVIAGTASGVGKTTVATGLMAALRARGDRVAGFKVGPDFIDPGYHALATGRPGRNLDAYLCGTDLVAPLFAHGADGAQIAVIEGVMGLFDGVAGSGELASTAQVAKLLDAPVILVVDASSLSRSVAALVHGYTTFDRDLRLAGVVCNRVASARHTALLRDALDEVGVPLLGVIRRDAALVAPSRHLGLVPAAEHETRARRLLEALGSCVTRTLDLDRVVRIARSAPPLAVRAWRGTPRPGPPVTIAVAGGAAFSFRYTENLELLAAAGARLAPLDPTRDEALPEGTAGLYLGGGFPETYADELSANAPLRRAIRAHRGPVLAECGGLLYLSQSLDGRAMCARLPAIASMSDRLTLGYRRATATVSAAGWTAGDTVHGHEFHRSRIRLTGPATPAWRLDRDGRRDGIVDGQVHAGYLHTHWAATPQVAHRFLTAARTVAPATRAGEVPR